MNTPYNTGKVLIGLRYERPMPVIQGDALTLQSALLDPSTLVRQSWLVRALNVLWRLA
jgi:hypothetical protein